MRDLDIRLALRRDVLAQHESEPDTRIVEELSLCLCTSRVDVAVVNGSLHGYEIKSQHDTLVRLLGQSQTYSRALDFVTLVTASAHAEKALKLIPEWWGVLEVIDTSEFPGFHVRRTAAPNPCLDPLAVAQLLWREEALRVLASIGADVGVRSKPRRHLWQKLTRDLSLDEVRAATRVSIKQRPPQWLAAERPGSGGGSFQPSAT